MNTKTSKGLTPRKKLLIGLAILLVLIFIVMKLPWAPWNIAKSISFGGTVIDKETMRPVEGVVVLVFWPLMTSSLAGVHGAGIIEIKETITDSHGTYQIPGWEKNLSDIGKGGFRDSDPKIFLNKAGYWPKELHNDYLSEKYFGSGKTWKSDWDGKTIEFAPIHSQGWSPKDWEKYLDRIKSYFKAPGGLCNWLRFPYSYIENDRMKSEAYAKAFYNSNRRVFTSLYDVFYEKKECGVDPVKYYLEHGMTIDPVTGFVTPQQRPSTQAYRHLL